MERVVCQEPGLSEPLVWGWCLPEAVKPSCLPGVPHPNDVAIKFSNTTFERSDEAQGIDRLGFVSFNRSLTKQGSASYFFYIPGVGTIEIRDPNLHYH
jgi:hypothetical protein